MERAEESAARRALKAVLALLLCLACIPAQALAPGEAWAASNGEEGTSQGDIYWTVLDSGKLVISDGVYSGAETVKAEGTTNGVFGSKNDVPWSGCGQIITEVMVDGVSPTSTAYWFAGLDSLKSLDILSLNTSRVVDMSHMFDGCFQLKSIDVSGLDTGNVQDMSFLFKNCGTRELNLSNFDTGNVTTMRGMFQGSYARSLDLSNFATSNVTDMGYMFAACHAKTLDLSSFDTGSVTKMDGMFYGSDDVYLRELDLSSFTITERVDRSEMFDGSHIEKIVLSDKCGVGGLLPAPMRELVPNALGKWVNERGEVFDADEIPANTAGIYTAQLDDNSNLRFTGVVGYSDDTYGSYETSAKRGEVISAPKPYLMVAGKDTFNADGDPVYLPAKFVGWISRADYLATYEDENFPRSFSDPFMAFGGNFVTSSWVVGSDSVETFRPYLFDGTVGRDEAYVCLYAVDIEKVREVWSSSEQYCTVVMRPFWAVDDPSAAPGVRYDSTPYCFSVRKGTSLNQNPDVLEALRIAADDQKVAGFDQLGWCVADNVEDVAGVPSSDIGYGVGKKLTELPWVTSLTEGSKRLDFDVPITHDIGVQGIWKRHSSGGDAPSGSGMPTEQEQAVPSTPSAPAPAAATGIAKGKTATAGTGASKAKYTATGAKTVTYKAPASKKAKKITVPSTVKINGKTYKVTKIANDAFKGSAATSITVGSNVTTISAKAFRNATKVKTITIGKNVKKVSAKAFAKNKSLRTVVIKSKKLAKKSALKSFLKGSKVTKVQVKVGTKAQNKKYVKTYKKLLTKKIAGKRVTVK